MNNKLSMSIRVKDTSKLEKYGFVKEWSKRWSFYSGNIGKYGKPVCSMDVSTLRKSRIKDKLTINSKDNLTIKTICEMYKDGILEFLVLNDEDIAISKKEKQIAKLQAEISELRKGAKK